MEIDPGALERNCRRLAAALPSSTRLLPMLKADGYGLGAVRVARALTDCEPWGFGVATVEEGVELRDHGFELPVVVFSPCPPRDARPCLEEGLEPAVSSLRALETFGEAAAAEGHVLAVHLEVDTGMGRLGLLAGEAEDWVPRLSELLARLPVRLSSTFTHFHSADTDDEATRRQAAAYSEVRQLMVDRGLEPGKSHLSNSPAILRFGAFDADLARPGIYLYGVGPEETAVEPVAAVRARVLDVREVPGGHSVSYGATFRTDGPTRLATLGVGYGDGLRRDLSNRGHVLLGGRRASILGAVCMDTTVVDATSCPGVEPGDVATLLGSDEGESIGLETMARWCSTIPYEILTGLGARLPRVERGADEAAVGQEEDVA